MLSTHSYAQFGDVFNRARDAINKITEKKEDLATQPTNQPITAAPANNRAIAPQAETSQLGTIYFSNKPFPADGGTEGSKTAFTSNEFIYGRLVLKNGTVREVLKPSPFKVMSFLVARLGKTVIRQFFDLVSPLKDTEN